MFPVHLSVYRFTLLLLVHFTTCVACGNSSAPIGGQAAPNGGQASPIIGQTPTTDSATLTNTPASNSRAKQKLPTENAWYRIYKFVDGDTFWLDDSTAIGTKIRLIGMDTPETKNMFKKKKHPMGKQVAQYVETLLTGAKVRLEYDVQKHDQYGQVLAYVFLEDGTQLNAHLIEKGYAWLMTVPPNVRYADAFYTLQVKSREGKLGVWADGDFEINQQESDE